MESKIINTNESNSGKTCGAESAVRREKLSWRQGVDLGVVLSAAVLVSELQSVSMTFQLRELARE